MLLLSNIATPTFHDTPLVRIVEQGYRLRLLSFGLGFVAAAAVLAAAGAPFVLLAMFGLCAGLWPGVARMLALRSGDPAAFEKRNLLIDSAIGGAWIALMQFNVLPCALLTIVLSCDKTMSGGWILTLRGLTVQAAACVLTLALHGLVFAPESSMLQIAACLPLLIAYPLALSLRLRQQGHSESAATIAAEFTSDTRIA